MHGQDVGNNCLLAHQQAALAVTSPRVHTTQAHPTQAHRLHRRITQTQAHRLHRSITQTQAHRPHRRENVFQEFLKDQFT